MKCPVCDVTLSISSREGVEIDFCPQCRGVWLDRGELDKILDRVATAAPVAPVPPPPAYDDRSRPPEPRYDDRPHRHDDRPRYDDRSRSDDRDRDRDRGHDPRRKKKKGSFLEDIFDFG